MQLLSLHSGKDFNIFGYRLFIPYSYNSDNLPVVRKARADPKLTRDEKLIITEKWRNHVSAVSTIFSNIGFLIMTGAVHE